MTVLDSRPADSMNETRTRPHGLLTPTDHDPGRADGMSVRTARSLVFWLLRRLGRDRLIIIDSTRESRPILAFGPGTANDGRSSLEATIDVRDGRAWTALITEGSVGLGRGYLEGWWDSDDPVTVVRIVVRNIGWLDKLRNRLAATTSWATDRIRAYLPRPGRSRNKEDIARHYDLGNEFFEIFLDETLTYSSAVFPRAQAPLAEASRNKYDRILLKLGITAEHSVLEIGTGWGGFALRAADSVGCEVTTTTISEQQLAEATRRVRAAASSSRVTLLDADWRDLTGRFDRIVSIEMIEAVDWRDYDAFFATIERCLQPDGLVAIQAICVPDRRYERTKNTEDFIRRFIFPGGFLPSIGAISRSLSRSTQLQILDIEDLSAHYAETLRRWRRGFDERIEEVKALGLDDRFCRLWRFYLAYCEAGFSERHCLVNQIVLAGPEWRPNGLETRPH